MGWLRPRSGRHVDHEWRNGVGWRHVRLGLERRKRHRTDQWGNFESVPSGVPADSIKGASVLDVTGTGKVVITGNYVTSVSNYVSAGKITANGGPNVFYGYDSGANKTTISAVLLPAPQQSITAVSVSGGNVTITYQTTHRDTRITLKAPPVCRPPRGRPWRAARTRRREPR